MTSNNSAYSVFSKARQSQFENRLRGQANPPLTSAIGVCTIWLREHRDMTFTDFMKQLDDPVFVYGIRNLGPRRIELIKEYFNKR
jgi:hypothetical protein